MVLEGSFPPDLRVENEAISLVRAGHKVGILSFDAYPESEVKDYKGITVYRVAISKRHRNKMHGLAGMIPWMDRFVAGQVSKILSTEQYDAIHFHDLYLFGAARLIRQKFDGVFIGDMHENYVEVLKDYQWANSFPNNLLISHSKWERKEKEWLAEMDKMITVTEGIRQRIISKGIADEEVILVPNTIQPRLFDEFALDEAIIEKFSSTFNLVYIGGFVGNRGLEHVVEGMKYLKEYSGEIKLILVGDGSTRQNLEAITARHRLQDVIHFEGWQSQEKMKSYLEVSNIGLVPFKRTPQTDNSSSNKLFQYMYFGLPILGTNCTSVKRLVENENCGLIYESESVDQFVENAIKLFKDGNLCYQLGENGKQAIAQKYNWDITVRDMLDMYSGFES